MMMINCLLVTRKLSCAFVLTDWGMLSSACVFLSCGCRNGIDISEVNSALKKKNMLRANLARPSFASLVNESSNTCLGRMPRTTICQKSVRIRDPHRHCDVSISTNVALGLNKALLQPALCFTGATP